jgi:hypothetical protein
MLKAFSVHASRRDSNDPEVFVVVTVKTREMSGSKKMLSFDVEGHGGSGLPKDMPKGPNWYTMNVALEPSPTVKPEDQYAEWLQQRLGPQWRVTVEAE